MLPRDDHKWMLVGGGRGALLQVNLPSVAGGEAAGSLGYNSRRD